MSETSSSKKQQVGAFPAYDLAPRTACGVDASLPVDTTTTIAFITNFCPHYRVETFRKLANKYKVFFYFFSQGTEWYWLKEHGVRNGDFHGEYVGGKGKSKSRMAIELAQKLWRVPCDAYVKCINGRIALPLTFLIARLRGKPFVLWTGIWQTLETPFHRLVMPATRFVYRHSDAIVVYGDHVKSYLVSQGVDPQRIFIAHHAVDNDSYSLPVASRERSEFRARFQIEEDARIVLYLGRLESIKGISFLLKAFASLRESKVILLLVGQGSEAESLAALAKSLGIADRVRFAGYIPPENTTTLYSLSYVLVLPSISTRRGREPWGLVVNEAMNQGLPVIATDAVGAAAGGLVRDRHNGFIVPERNVQKLADALAKLLDSPKLRAQMSQNARESIAGWNNDKMIEGFCRAIEFALNLQPKAWNDATTP